ncbi:MAG: HEAT repeat domain-containing protein, partial [Planctomycetes bacterium]|nr:HEAT repeat domain-containing protein [Planctomycetota bacterium]
MRPSVATNPSARCRRRSHPVAGLLALCALAACASQPDVYTPGKLDQDQLQRCRAVAQAYVDEAPEYVALRDELREDPVAIRWFVRYLEQQAVAAREGRAELLSEQKVRLDQIRAMRAEPAQFELPGQRRDRRAIGQIVAIGEPAVEVVIRDLLVSRQEFLRTIGIEVLTGIGDAAVPALLELARNGDDREQRVAARALGAVGARGPALAALRELTRSPVWRVRSDAVQALDGGGDEARDLLVGMLADEDPFVRKKAAETLANYPDAVAAAALVAFLELSKQRNDWPGEVAAQHALQQIAGADGPRTAQA